MNDSAPEKPLTTGEWVITHLILMIPFVNIVMHFVWAFTDGNISRRNFCRARLIIFAVVLGLALIVLLGLLLFTGLLTGFANKYH